MRSPLTSKCGRISRTKPNGLPAARTVHGSCSGNPAGARSAAGKDQRAAPAGTGAGRASAGNRPRRAGDPVPARCHACPAPVESRASAGSRFRYQASGAAFQRGCSELAGPIPPPGKATGGRRADHGDARSTQPLASRQDSRQRGPSVAVREKPTVPPTALAARTRPLCVRGPCNTAAHRCWVRTNVG